MSLYNNVANDLASKGLTGSIQSGISGAISGAGKSAVAALGGGKLAQMAVSAASSSAAQAAKKVTDKYLPAQLRGKIDAAARVGGSILNGNWEQAGIAAFEGGLLDGVLSNLSGAGKTSKPIHLAGGVSLDDLRRCTEEVAALNHTRKNMFVVEIASLSEGDQTGLFNMLAVDVDYEPFNIAGDKGRIGGAVLDSVIGQEAVEMRMTTFDDGQGSLKHFFARHHAAVAARDGTVGVPADYGLRIKIIHGAVRAGNNVSTVGYEDIGLFRVGSLNLSMSRREQALQELQLTFTQLDTFMKP